MRAAIRTATWKPLCGSHEFPQHYDYGLKSKRSTVHRNGVTPPVLTGCYNKRVIRLAPQETEGSGLNRVVGVTTLENERVSFARSGEVRGETVYGTVETRSDGETELTPYEIPLSEVGRLWLEERKLAVARLLTGLAVVLGAVLAVFNDPE